MKKTEVFTVFHGLEEFFRSSSVNNPLPGTAFKQYADRTLYSCGVDFAPCNGVIEKNGTSLEEKFIKDTIEFFQSRKLPFLWWTENKMLENYGFSLGGVMSGISVNLNNDSLVKFGYPAGLQIKMVQNDEDLIVFSRIIGECFGMAPHLVKQYQTFTGSAMKHQEQIHFVAYLNQKPVATITLSTTKTSAGIWNFATLPEYRRKGIGMALTHRALIEAKNSYKDVMAVLMPKGLARGVFQHFNFKEVCQLPFYMHGTPQSLEK